MTVSSLLTPKPQLTLNFEPTLPDRYGSLRTFLAHQMQVQSKPMKTIAADMDIAPSTLSRKLNASEGDTQRFNCDDLELYMRLTGDTSPIEYLASKFLHSDAHRQARVIARVEHLATELERAMQSLKAVA